jgi:hypothetical protein
MAISTIIKTKRDGTIVIDDGTRTLEIAYEQGDLNLSIPGPSITLNLDRGQIGATPSIRYADDAPITGTFTANLRDLTDAAYSTLEGILTNSGYFDTTWVSTLGATAEIKTVTITWTIEGTDHGDATDHTITLAYCVLTGSLSEGDPGKVSVSFTSYALWPTVT